MNSSDTPRTSMAYRITQRCLGVAVCLLLMAVSSYAQAATPASKLAFDEVGQALAVVQGATYNAVVDTAAPVPLAGVACIATTLPVGATCTATLPAMTVGTHILTVTQTISGAVSPQSAPLSFSFVVVVTPTNVRISGL